MSLSEELNRLADLHRSGALTDGEFAQAKARVLRADSAGSEGTAAGGSPLSALNTLRRSRGERWVAGVCGGLAQATGLQPWAWRLGFVLLSLWGGAGMLAYALLWIFVPSE